MIVADGQNIMDICLEHYGTLDVLVELCYINDISIDTVLSAGQVLELPGIAGANNDIANYFATRQRQINTGEKPLLDLAYRVTDDADRVIDNNDLRIIS